MKILYLTSTLALYDGWGRYSKDVVHEVANAGHDVRCVVQEIEDNATIEQQAVLEKPVNYMANPVRSYRAAAKVQSVIDRFRPDIVHILAEPYMTLLPFLKVQNARVVATLHGTYAYFPAVVRQPKRLIAHMLYRFAVPKLDTAIAVSTYTANYAKLQMPSLNDKVRVITNGVREVPTHVDRADNEGRKRILFVGSVKPRKGLYEALQALAKYNELYGSDVVYDIVGTYDKGSQYVQKLRGVIAANGLEKNVQFHGQVPDDQLQSFYRSADCYLMLSRHRNGQFEGFGLVYLEAASYGVPSIGSIESGASDAIKEGETGFIVDPDDSKAAARALHDILDPQQEWFEACRAWAKHHLVSVKVKEILKVYSQ